jgi:hypothetical protein
MPECEFKPCSECGENNPVPSVVVSKYGDVACNVFWCPECQHITLIDEDRIPDWFRARFVEREKVEETIARLDGPCNGCLGQEEIIERVRTINKED